MMSQQKQDMLKQFPFNFGPPSNTLDQRYTNIDSMTCVWTVH